MWLRALALSEDISLIPRTYILTHNPCNSTSKGSSTLFCPPWHLHTFDIYLHRHIHITKKYIKIKISVGLFVFFKSICQVLERCLAALAGDESLVPNTHVSSLTVVYNSSFRKSSCLRPCGTCTQVHIHRDKQIHAHTNLKNNFLKKFTIFLKVLVLFMKSLTVYEARHFQCNCA